MRKLYGFTTLILLCSYVGFLYVDTRRIFTYTTERYFYVILISGLVIGLLGLFGMFYSTKSESFRNRISFIKNLITDKKILLLLILCALAVNISPLFFLMAGALFLVPFKNSSVDILLKENIFRPFLLILVLFSGLFIQSGQISSATADQRIGNLNSVNLGSEGSRLNSFSSNSEDYDIGDWIISLSYNSDLETYVGKKVDLVGFVFAPKSVGEDMFIIARFVIRCCAADATPVGLKVRYDWDSNFKVDDWVRVKGSFVIENINGNDELIVVPESVENTEVPDRPYIS